jgi:phospholipase C
VRAGRPCCAARRRRSPSLLLVLGTTAAALLLLAAAAAAAGPTPTGPIKNVVVVVMENRSFDHMLGWMKRLNPEIDGVTGAEWNPANTTDPGAGPRVYFGEGAQYVDPDPGHSFQEIRQQIFGSDDASGPPRMDGFVQQARSLGGGDMADAVMHGFAPDSVAVYRELVAQFAVCDRWFASVPSSTQPNRLFVHSATSGGATSNNPQYVSSSSRSLLHYLLIDRSIAFNSAAPCFSYDFASWLAAPAFFWIFVACERER